MAFPSIFRKWQEIVLESSVIRVFGSEIYLLNSCILYALHDSKCLIDFQVCPKIL